MRKPVIAGNWKMFKLTAEAIDTAVRLRSGAASVSGCEILVAPVFTAIKPVADRLEGSNVAIAAQDCATQNDFGALTGEVAPVMLRDAGASHVIIGHSERRQFFGETDESVRKKAAAAIAAGLTAIVCVGETLEERESGRAERVVGGQLASGLSGLTVADVERIIIAYEPVWAIGTGKTATPEQAQEMHAFIRRELGVAHGPEAAEATRILYGGSVKPDNIGVLMAQPDVDGALVGGASLEAESFLRIVNFK